MLLRLFQRLLIVAGVMGMVWPVAAQEVSMRTLSTDARGVVVEVTATWPRPLQAARATEMPVLDEDLLLQVSGGQLEATQSFELPDMGSPTVRVLAADFDETSVSQPEDSPGLVTQFHQPEAALIGLGWERKRPVATLLARLVTYDPGKAVLRRYRRMVVALDYGQSPVRAKRDGVSDNPHLQVTQSVLADGIIYRLAFQEEGVYRIDRNLLSRLPDLGVALNAIDPNNIQVFGNGGRPLPALNKAPRLADLVEVPVFVQGGGDGSFDANDGVFFYAKGNSGWEIEVELDNNDKPVLDPSGNPIRHWKHYVHPFSGNNYYFIKINARPSARVGQQPFPNLANPAVLTQIKGHAFLDLDEYMWSKEHGTGHTWVSNLVLGGASRTFFTNQKFPGQEAGRVTYQARIAAWGNPGAPIIFTSNGQELSRTPFEGLTNSSTVPAARSAIVSFDQTVTDAGVTLTMQMGNNASTPKGAMDWIRIFYPQALRATNNYLRFHTALAETGAFEMVLRDFSEAPQVWDVTTPGQYVRLGVQSGGGGYRVQVEVTDPAIPRELVAFSPGVAKTITFETACPVAAQCRVTPQNLHGITSFPEFVIVTPDIFRPYADELAELRRAEGLEVRVVDLDEIYNEFSGGIPDMRAVRDYFKFLYDRDADTDPRFRYALLFGDGHFDFKKRYEKTTLENWIFPFETEESFDSDASYTSDDYFGLLDDNEGLWPYTPQTFGGNQEHLNEHVDLGVGRFTVQTVEEARTMIDKIKRYGQQDTFGAWRTRYLFLADDGPKGSSGNDFDLHTQNTDVVAERVFNDAPEINQKKVYAISYPRVFLNGWKVPEAHQDILKAIDEGVLVVNYSGHGGEDGLADEGLLTMEDIRAFTNKDRLPIYITATCSFGRWDLSDEQTSAEELLKNPEGGAIAMLTTVRTVYTTGGTTSLNVGLNYELNHQLFMRDDDGLPRRLGDVLRLTKNQRVGYEGNNRKFNLLGDPTMRIGLPQARAVVKTVNGVAVDQQTAPLRGLDKLTLTGEIHTPGGQLFADFNGTVTVSILDAQRQIMIDPSMYRYMPNPYYTIREDLIWRGTVQANQGLFSATFVVPKDISYSNEPGRIAVYAHNGTQQAFGFTENVKVGGTTDNPPTEKDGPEITLYLDDEAFVSGSIIHPRPRLFIRFFDESGINTVGAGVGHEMLLVVDENEQEAINLGDLYESEENSFQRGNVTYAFEEPFEPGPHTLTVRAWDVLNNSNKAALDFVVADQTDLAVENVYNIPNPTTGPTRFIFEHNQPPGKTAKVQVRIYTLTGRPVQTLEQEGIFAGSVMQMTWDGRDEDGDRLASGIYLYKLRVEVEDNTGITQVVERVEKLAIIR